MNMGLCVRKTVSVRPGMVKGEANTNFLRVRLKFIMSGWNL